VPHGKPGDYQHRVKVRFSVAYVSHRERKFRPGKKEDDAQYGVRKYLEND